MRNRHILLLSFIAFTSLIASAQAQTMVAQQPPLQSPPPGWQPPPATIIVEERNCHHYTDSFTIGRETRVTHGMACLQPDGSWALRPSTAAVNYVARGGNIFLMPTQQFEVAPPPATTEVIIDHSHHRGW